MVTNMFSKMNSNDLESLKVYLDSNESSISQYANSVECTYSVSPQIFLENGKNIRQVNPDNLFRLWVWALVPPTALCLLP